jgi:hypothetical protein
MPQGTNLVSLVPRSEGVVLDTQGNKVFEMVGFGICLAGFPAPDRMPGDTKKFP